MAQITISKTEAAALLTSHAFRVDDADSCNHGRTLIHCFSGPFGCDWDLAEALEAVTKADEVAFVSGFAGHELAVRAGADVYLFDVRLTASLSDPAAIGAVDAARVQDALIEFGIIRARKQAPGHELLPQPIRDAAKRTDKGTDLPKDGMRSTAMDGGQKNGQGSRD